MKIYIIVEKEEDRLVEIISDRDMILYDGTICPIGMFFFNEEDAIKYLKDFGFSRNHRVCSATIDN